MLAEYGAFEILGYQTFTTEIFTEYRVSFNVPAACSLSWCWWSWAWSCSGRRAGPGQGTGVRTRPAAPSGLARHRLGRADRPVLAGFVVLVGLALGVPVGASVYWVLEGGAARRGRRPHGQCGLAHGALQR